jgi:hypothetical protein
MHLSARILLFPTIEISQLWSNNTNLSFFIQYHSEGQDSVCEGIPDFSYEDTLVKDLECYDGWTDVGIFVYFDDELSIEECEECKLPASDDDNVVAYYFEVR